MKKAKYAHARVSEIAMKRYGKTVRNGLCVHPDVGSSASNATHLSISTTAFVVNMLPASEPPSAPTQKPETKGELMMSRCSEVRKATEIDPASKVMGKPVTGTKALRASSLKDRNRAFSLIFPQRTLDIECQSEVECRFYMRGFRRWRAESVHSEAHT